MIILGTNYINVKPTIQYPYGLDKVKNIVVMIPATLFFGFGCETIYGAFCDYLSPEAVSESGHAYSVLVNIYKKYKFLLYF